MDLNSLPDEMLTLVLKKCLFKKTILLRKMNSRIDRLAKRAKTWEIIPVKKLEIGDKYTNLLLRESYAKKLRLKSRKPKFNHKKDETTEESLNEWLAKVQINRVFNVYGHCQFVRLGEVIYDEPFNIIEVFKKYRASLRRVRHIHFRGVNFTEPIDTVVRHLFQVCKHLKKLQIYMYAKNNANRYTFQGVIDLFKIKQNKKRDSMIFTTVDQL